MQLKLTIQEAEILQRALAQLLHQANATDYALELLTILDKVADAQSAATRLILCPVCQQTFTQEAVGRTGRYCSAACKQKAYRQRRNEWRRQHGTRFSA